MRESGRDGIIKLIHVDGTTPARTETANGHAAARARDMTVVTLGKGEMKARPRHPMELTSTATHGRRRPAVLVRLLRRRGVTIPSETGTPRGIEFQRRSVKTKVWFTQKERRKYALGQERRHSNEHR